MNTPELIVTQIEEEHLEIVTLLNKCIDSIDEMSFKNYFYSLYNCIKNHFIHEEEFMLKVNYYGMIEHVKIHNDLKEELARLMTCTYLNILEQIDVIKSLKDVVLNHMNENDVELEQYIEKFKTL